MSTPVARRRSNDVRRQSRVDPAHLGLKRAHLQQQQGGGRGGQESDSRLDASVTDRSETMNPSQRQKLENTYQLEPERTFVPSAVRKAVEAMLKDRLEGQVYESQTARELSVELSSHVLERVKLMSFRRYKLVVLVQLGPGGEGGALQLGSRCLWNHLTDNSATATYHSRDLYAVANIYACYFD